MRTLAPLSLLLLLGVSGTGFAQPALDVVVPPVEIGAAFSYDVQRPHTADTPGGAGALVSVDGNLTEHCSIVAELSDAARTRAVLAGARLTTGFYRDGGTRIPGRFFVEGLAGRNTGGSAASGGLLQAGAGADLLVTRGAALRVALDYLFTPGAPRDFAGGRVLVGVVLGPRMGQ
jgi:hypothetical protein